MDCAVCFAEACVAPVRCKPCAHTFCGDCIRAWAKVKQTCPMCTRSIEKPPPEVIDVDALSPEVIDVDADTLPGYMPTGRKRKNGRPEHFWDVRRKRKFGTNVPASDEA